MKKLFLLLTTFFTKNSLGTLLYTLLASAAKEAVNQILDPTNQAVAYSFVVNLNLRTDLSGSEKRKIFNKQMANWALQVGKKLAISSINCLRELAVTAAKVEKDEIQSK